MCARTRLLCAAVWPNSRGSAEWEEGGNRRKGRAGGVKGGVKQTRGSAWRKKRKRKGSRTGRNGPHEAVGNRVRKGAGATRVTSSWSCQWVALGAEEKLWESKQDTERIPVRFPTLAALAGGWGHPEDECRDPRRLVGRLPGLKLLEGHATEDKER